MPLVRSTVSNPPPPFWERSSFNFPVQRPFPLPASDNSAGGYHGRHMSPADIPPLTPERWIDNLLGAIGDLADREHQEERWLAPDACAWENPNELISRVDDCNFELFLTEFAPMFSPEQQEAALNFRGEFDSFCNSTPQVLTAKDVLSDPRWERVRQRAAEFAGAFKGKWP